MIVVYKLENNQKPSWISDGGYYYDQDDQTIVGTTSNAPDGILAISKSDLLTRVLNIHSKYPYVKPNSVTDESFSISEVTDNFNLWWKNKT